MSIAGHVSRAMVSRYSHVRVEAKLRTLSEIAARQRAADEKRPRARFAVPRAAPRTPPPLSFRRSRPASAPLTKPATVFGRRPGLRVQPRCALGMASSGHG